MHIRYGLKSSLAGLRSKSTFSTGFFMGGATKRTQPPLRDTKTSKLAASLLQGISKTWARPFFKAVPCSTLSRDMGEIEGAYAASIASGAAFSFSPGRMRNQAM